MFKRISMSLCIFKSAWVKVGLSKSATTNDAHLIQVNRRIDEIAEAKNIFVSY